MYLQFPLSTYEMNQLATLELRLNLNQGILQFSDEENRSFANLINALIQYGVLKDAEIDNCNAYFVTGEIASFKKWIEIQNENARNFIKQKGGTDMPFELLSNNCELLLQEILEHRDLNGNCDLDYWKQRFEQLGFSEKSVLRSQFEILKTNNMISLTWADNVPYILFVLENGLSYFEQKKYAVQWNQSMLKKDASTIKKDYDVFISHASKDKLEYVDELYGVIRKLGISIFYDTEIISWGDNWKQVILDGTAKSEFAIIVISNNYFGREWTERELNEFLERQNASGQKIVLPLLYNISVNDMKNHYPSLKEIQAIESKNYTIEEVTILFAKELIKRLR